MDIFCYFLGSLCLFIAFCVYLLYVCYMFSVLLWNILFLLVILRLFVGFCFCFFFWSIVVLRIFLYFLLAGSCYCSWSSWLFNDMFKSCFCFAVIHLCLFEIIFYLLSALSLSLELFCSYFCSFVWVWPFLFVVLGLLLHRTTPLSN